MSKRIIILAILLWASPAFATLTINIANAPGWAANTSYSVGARVIAGPGRTPGSPGNYTSGSNIFLWALSGAGGTSGGNQPKGFATCTSPANTGGGLNGSPPAGWSGTTNVSDNGLTWVCLAQVDYVTLTDAFLDSGVAWVTATPHYWGDLVTSAGGHYLMNTTNGTTPFTCTTGSIAPTSTSVGVPVSDGNCDWIYLGPATYSSGANIWPHQQYNAGSGSGQQPMIEVNYDIQLNLWYGGQAQQTYLVGSNGEGTPILMILHQDYGSDTNQNCLGDLSHVAFPGGAATATYCKGVLQWWQWTLTAAPGDSFQDNLTPLTGPLSIDTTKGVTLKNALTPVGPAGFTFTMGEPIAFSDSGGLVTRLQFLSTQGMCIAGHISGGPGFGHTNYIHLSGNIFDCGGSQGAINLDAALVADNNVIIVRSTTAASYAFNAGYPQGAIYENTVIGANTTNGSFLQNNATGAGLFQSPGAYFPPPIYSNVVFGFPVPWAFNSSWSSTLGANNATDQASGVSGTFTGLDGITYNKTDLPGTSLFNLTPSNELVNPSLSSGTLDARIKSASSSLYGGGATFSFATGGRTYGTFVPGADIFGTSRPVSGRYDIGAEMFTSGTPIGGNRRGLFH